MKPKKKESKALVTLSIHNIDSLTPCLAAELADWLRTYAKLIESFNEQFRGDIIVEYKQP